MKVKLRKGGCVLGVTQEQLSFDLEKYKELLKDDILFEHIAGTDKEELLFSEDYLVNLKEKTWYTTNEVAEWFGVSDGQLRYYVKPFYEYIFSEDNPSLSTAYRVNIESTFRLRMIIMLKDQHRLQGLKKLLGVGQVSKVTPKNSNDNSPGHTGGENQRVEQLEKQIANLTNMMGQLLNTGVFELKDGENGKEIILKEDFISDKLKMLQPPSEVIDLSEFERKTESVVKENEKLQKQVDQIVKDKKVDVAVRMKESQIQNEVIAKLRAEATKKWADQSKFGFIAKITKQEEIAADRESFISDYIANHLNERLSDAFAKYHETTLGSSEAIKEAAQTTEQD